MRTLERILCLALAIACCASTASADVAAELNTRWNGKTITLRAPDRSNTVMFNSQGEPTGKVSPGLWATDALLQVSSVTERNQHLRIEGKRVAVYFDRKQGTFAQIVTKKDVTVEAEMPTGSIAAEQFAPVLGKIFLTGSEKVTDLAPSYWDACLKGDIVKRDGGWRCEGKNEKRVDPVTGLPPEFSGKPIAKAGARVSAPQPVSTPDPDYTEIAKKMNIQSTTILWLIVDANGIPKDIQVVSPIGFGLDDQAVRAVERWRFRPAMLNGMPVPVQINVEVNFRLY